MPRRCWVMKVTRVREDCYGNGRDVDAAPRYLAREQPQRRAQGDGADLRGRHAHQPHGAARVDFHDLDVGAERERGQQRERVAAAPAATAIPTQRDEPRDREQQRDDDAALRQPAAQQAQQWHDEHGQAANEGVAVGRRQGQALDLEQVTEEQQHAERGAGDEIRAARTPQERRQQQRRDGETYQDDPDGRKMGRQFLHRGKRRSPHEDDDDEGEDAAQMLGHEGFNRVWQDCYGNGHGRTSSQRTADLIADLPGWDVWPRFCLLGFAWH